MERMNKYQQICGTEEIRKKLPRIKECSVQNEKAQIVLSTTNV